MFRHVTRACQDVIFRSVEWVRERMERTSTTAGLAVTAALLPGELLTGRKVDPERLAAVRLKVDEVLPEFNCRVLPAGN